MTSVFTNCAILDELLSEIVIILPSQCLLVRGTVKNLQVTGSISSKFTMRKL